MESIRKIIEGGMKMRKISMRQAINEALHIAFNSDSSVFSIGEDIATYGGQLRCSYDLIDNFGEERIMDTPISENAIMGVAIGASMMGLRPVVELSYIDFIGVCFDQIMNQAAKLRYMYGGNVSLPLVVRTQGGAGLGNGAQHSQSLEALLAHIPGIRVVMPSNAYDAKGLLLRAIRDNNPTIFIEHKALYKKKCEVPDEIYECDYNCDVKREGKDITIVAYSSMVDQALKAAETLAEEGVEAEVVDVRCLEPFDADTIIASVNKTGKAVVAHEANVKGGFGAEIASVIQEKAFDKLEKPIKRVGAPNVPVPFSPVLENAFVPNADNILKAVRSIL
jgi:pyruvate/2-oxoglutarate/acetoin dehydrogenase E1 component